MLTFLQYLFAHLIASYAVLPPGQSVPQPDAWGIALTTAAFGLAWATWGRLAGRRTPEDAARALPAYLRTVAIGRVTALATFWVVARTLHGREIPHALGLDDVLLLPHLIRLVPFAVLLLLLRAALNRLGARLEAESPRLLDTWRQELSEALLPLAPLVPILLVQDLLESADTTSFLGATSYVLRRIPLAQALLALTVLFAALLAIPFVLRLIWRARPLERGPLRERLERYASSVGLRTREILVWPTGGASMNAAVIGALPRFRYVILTDGLVETLGHDEIEAVFAHEAGHAKRGHVLLFFGFTATLVLLSSTVSQATGPAVEALDGLVQWLAMLLVWIGVVFGWVSRRFEQEADVFGIDTVPFRPAPDGRPPDPVDHPFGRALERIAEEAGGIREITGWRHFSIGDRIAFVRAYLTDAAVRRRYRRSIRLLRGTLLGVMACALAIAGTQAPGAAREAAVLWSVARDPAPALLDPLRRATMPGPAEVRARELVQAASLAARAGKEDAALRWLRSAASLAPGDAYVLAEYALALDRAGRPRGAARAWRDLLALPDLPTTYRKLAEEALVGLPGAED